MSNDLKKPDYRTYDLGETRLSENKPAVVFGRISFLIMPNFQYGDSKSLVEEKDYILLVLL